MTNRGPDRPSRHISRPELNRELAHARLVVRAATANRSVQVRAAVLAGLGRARAGTAAGITRARRAGRRRLVGLAAAAGGAGVLVASLLAAVTVATLALTVVLAPAPGSPSDPVSAAAASAAPVPATPPGPAAVAPAQVTAPQTVTHPVRRGETLSAIALRYRVPFELIAAQNGLANPNRIPIGRTLTIPPLPPDVTVIAAGSTPASMAAANGLTIAQLTALNPQLDGPGGFLAGGLLRLGPG